MIWRDGTGRALADYPRPSVAVDVALLTVEADRLGVVVHHRDADPVGLALPGTFVHVDETLADAALRALREKVGVTGRSPAQLRVFDAVDRDSRGRVLGVAHVDLVPAGSLPAVTTVPAEAATGLAFDHDEVVAAAVGWARARYAAAPDPAGLLGPEFTLAELLAVHQAVAGDRLQKDTFRRRMIDELVETGASTRGTVGKPARLFRRA